MPPRPALAAAPANLPVAIDASNPMALYLDSGIVGRLTALAETMAKSPLVPQHLRGKPGDCFLVASQAMRWSMDPFAVAQCSYVTQGKLGYEGKLIAGVVNSSGKLVSSLNYEYSGAGDDRRVVVSGRLRSDPGTLRTIDGTVKGWKTANEKWRTMADQMLAYRGAREWARRHMPEAVLGIAAEDEIAPAGMRDVTPARTILATDADAFERAAHGVPAEEPVTDVNADGEVIEPAREEPPRPQQPTRRFLANLGDHDVVTTRIDKWKGELIHAAADATPERALELRNLNAPILDDLRDEFPDHVAAVCRAFDERIAAADFPGDR